VNKVQLSVDQRTNVMTWKTIWSRSENNLATAVSDALPDGYTIVRYGFTLSGISNFCERRKTWPAIICL